MFRRFFLPLLALAGILFGIFMIYYGSKQPPVSRILYPPPVVPYQHYIAGQGLIESAYKNISIGASFNDIITDVYVAVGDYVRKGDPLFTTDTRHLNAQLDENVQQEKLAQTNYENQNKQFSFYTKLKEKSAVSEQEYTSANYNEKTAKNALDVARAAVEQTKIDIERSTVKAPIDGQVLQLNIRVGQYATSNAYDTTPLILFGDTSIYHLRVEIDEEDAWRFEQGAAAIAFVRGNADISIPLEYVYSEPYIIPKESLSGADNQRIDTRVLQVVYSFEKDKYPVFMGQLLDVYIQVQQPRNSP